MATLPSFKTKIAPLVSSKTNQSNQDSFKPFLKRTYSPYCTMNFKPTLLNSRKAANSKGFDTSKGFDKNINGIRSFEDYLIQGYGEFYKNQKSLKKINEPAFELMKKEQRIKNMKNLGLKIL